eukprot:GHRQ01032388.1.p1 GENE.GHRQ01032388.1~~GHRQ01032388.1.p1  ORF type:complete len:127 (-),score=39.82 GHRQ01032388.1:359-739(-)
MCSVSNLQQLPTHFTQHCRCRCLLPSLLRCACAGVVCGAAASGKYVWNDPQDIAQLLTCCMMSGPFLTGYTQTINDYYDREIDAINEPYRPIPSGEAGRVGLDGGTAVLCLFLAFASTNSSSATPP